MIVMCDSDQPAKSQTDRDSGSSEEMIAILYAELRRLAGSKMRGLAPGQTLQATALVHEVYLRLSKEPNQRWDHRGHFFVAAAEAMRRILIEQARRKGAVRRAGNQQRVPIDEVEVQAPEPGERLLEVDAVLQELEAESPLQGQIVKLRFFGGLKHDEVANLLEISDKTVRRQWNFAKVWLYERITEKRKSDF